MSKSSAWINQYQCWCWNAFFRAELLLMMSSIQLSSCTYISCCYCAWNVNWAYTNGGQCFYRVIFPPRNETVQELYLDKCSFIYRRLSRGRRLENWADSPRICPCPQCGGLAVSCAARRGEQRGSGQSVGGGAGGENTVNMGPHLATVTILLANIALAASELSTAGRYYYPWSMQSEQYKISCHGDILTLFRWLSLQSIHFRH